LRGSIATIAPPFAIQQPLQSWVRAYQIASRSACSAARWTSRSIVSRSE
jgi:hypothetical protein